MKSCALYTRPVFNRRSTIERKLDKVLKNQVEMRQDIGQLKMDTAVNKALVLVRSLGLLFTAYARRCISDDSIIRNVRSSTHRTSEIGRISCSELM